MSYKNIGRWESSKYFVFEICKLQDIYSCNLFLSPVFYWNNYYFFFKKYQPILLLHLSTTNEAFLNLFEDIEIINDDLDEVDFYTHLTEPPAPEIKVEEDSSLIDIVYDLTALIQLPESFLFFHINKILVNWLYHHNLKVNLVNYLSLSSLLYEKFSIFDYWTRCITLHVIWSYIIKFIDKLVLEFFFIYPYNWEQPSLYNPHHFNDKILSFYFKVKALLNKRRNLNYIPFKLFDIADLEIQGTFFLHFKLDLWIPWMHFPKMYDFKLKSFFYIYHPLPVNRLALNNYYLFYDNYFYFLKKSKENTLFFQNQCNSIIYSLPIFLPLVPVLLNDDFLFFSNTLFFEEIISSKNNVFEKNKKGRPLKIIPNYFESEAFLFEDYKFYSQIDITHLYLKTKIFLLFNKIKFLPIFWFFLITVVVNLIKPFL